MVSLYYLDLVSKPCVCMNERWSDGSTLPQKKIIFFSHFKKIRSFFPVLISAVKKNWEGNFCSSGRKSDIKARKWLQSRKVVLVTDVKRLINSQKIKQKSVWVSKQMKVYWLSFVWSSKTKGCQNLTPQGSPPVSRNWGKKKHFPGLWVQTYK